MAQGLAHFFLITEQILGTRLFTFILGGLKKRFLRHLEIKLQDQPPVTVEWVDRRENLSPQEFHQEYFLKSRPVVFSGAAKDWPCCKKWGLDFFEQQHGSGDLLIVDAPGLTTHEEKNDFHFLTVQQLIQSIRQRGDKYLRFSPLMHEYPQLADDLDMNWLSSMRGGETFGNTYYMFIGGAGQVTHLHADQPCNLYVQVVGEKVWTLYTPDQSVYLYPKPTNTAYVKSPVDLKNPDHQNFPLFRHGKSIKAHIKAGDVLYVPPHIWHHVENLTETIAVGYRFSSLKAALNSSVVYSLLRVLSTNPPIWKTREYGKEDTNLIWAHASGQIKKVLELRERRRQPTQQPQTHRNHDEASK